MLLSGVTDVQGLASRLLEVALLRVAKVSLSAVKCKCFFLLFLQLFLARLCGLERTRVELPLFLQLLCHILLRGGTAQSWWQR